MFSRLHQQPCSVAGCRRTSDVCLVDIERRQPIFWGYYCSPHASERIRQVPRGETDVTFSGVDVQSADLRLIASSEQGAVFILGVGKDGLLQVNAGPCEGYMALSRMNTADRAVLSSELATSFISLVEILGAKADSVILADATEIGSMISYSTFYSVIVAGRKIIHKVRATDGIAIALYGRLPILVKEQVMAEVSRFAPQSLPWEAQ